MHFWPMNTNRIEELRCNDNLSFAGEWMTWILINAILEVIAVKKKILKMSFTSSEPRLTNLSVKFLFGNPGIPGKSYSVTWDIEPVEGQNQPSEFSILSDKKNIASFTELYVNRKITAPTALPIKVQKLVPWIPRKPWTKEDTPELLRRMMEHSLDMARAMAGDNDRRKDCFASWLYLVNVGNFWYEEPEDSATWYNYEVLTNEEGPGSSREFQIRIYATWDEIDEESKASTPKSRLCAVFNILTVRISQDGDTLNSDGSIKNSKS